MHSCGPFFRHDVEFASWPLHDLAIKGLQHLFEDWDKGLRVRSHLIVEFENIQVKLTRLLTCHFVLSLYLCFNHIILLLLRLRIVDTSL